MPAPRLDDLGKPGQPGLIIYDGVCVLCSGWFKFVSRRDARRIFYFTTIQSDFGRGLAQKLGIDPDDPQTNAVLLDGNVYLRSDSALTALLVLPGWGWVRIFKLVPKFLRDAVYTQIARNRYNWFGRYEVCDLGGNEYSGRVVG